MKPSPFSAPRKSTSASMSPWERKGTNLRIEVGIADATPFVEQDDVSQGR